MRRALSLALAATVLASLLGCGVSLGRLRTKGTKGAAAASTKKDCAACEKMCAVAGDAEKNPEAVDACKADCRKSCDG